MKKVLRFTLIFVFALITANQFLGNLIFNQDPLVIIQAALILAIFEIILKPIVKILFLPINLITLGLFRIVINTLGLYLAVFLLNNFRINNISLPTQNIFGVIIPPMQFAGFWAYLATSCCLSLVFNFFKLILTKSVKK